ncbi:MAG: hypothetical protein ACUVTG_14790 [Candidatus Oleimicrobiaceae bacterium]
MPSPPLGLPEKRLLWPVERPPTVSRLIPSLLHPKYRLAPYRGQAFQQTLDKLLAWARRLENQPGCVGLRIYIASGGSRKTRLLLEVGEVLRAEGWWAGFLASGEMDEHLAERLARDPRPTLLIVDYIAERSAEIISLLRALARAASDRDHPRTTPLALVLLERHLPDWLEQTLRSVSDPAYVGWPEFLSLPGVERQPHPLPELVREDERAEIFQQTVQHLQAYAATATPPPTYRPEELPGRPLFLLLLALHAAGERVPHSQDEEAILDYTWRREWESWQRLLRPVLQTNGVGWAEQEVLKVVEQVQVTATLGRAFPDAHALGAFLQSRFPPISGANDQRVAYAWLAKQFPRLFPATESGIVPPILPDPLADFVLEQALKQHPKLLRSALPEVEETLREPEEAAEAMWQALAILSRPGPQRPALWGRRNRSPRFWKAGRLRWSRLQPGSASGKR